MRSFRVFKLMIIHSIYAQSGEHKWKKETLSTLYLVHFTFYVDVIFVIFVVAQVVTLYEQINFTYYTYIYNVWIHRIIYNDYLVVFFNKKQQKIIIYS